MDNNKTETIEPTDEIKMTDLLNDLKALQIKYVFKSDKNVQVYNRCVLDINYMIANIKRNTGG